MFNSIIMPVMLITDAFLIFSYWDLDNPRTLYGVIALVLLVGFNLIQVLMKEVKTPWGVVQMRSETLDVIRWGVNLSTSMFLIWAFKIDEPEVVAFFILLLTFGAMTEVYSNKHKLITVGMAVTCFCILFFGVYDIHWQERVYMTSCYIGLVFVLWKLERLMLGEMIQFIREQHERRNVEKEAEGLQRDAAIGHYNKTINHELNALIGAANLSAFQIESNHSAHHDIDQEMKRLDCTLTHMNRVSSLVLDGLGGKRATIKKLSLKDLETDLNLLIPTHYQGSKAKVTFNFPENSEQHFFEERSSSTFLIIHNLVRNALEAVDEIHHGEATGKVAVNIAVQEKTFTIEVSDNGIGMSMQRIDDIKMQLGTTTKLEGHGLGLKFVQAECVKNNMQLDIDSKPRKHTAFRITAPLI
ncbi:sensor histidine kinase [Leucothrix sargassi]|nr:sensor histidine kinase [Leucothrix sargassi]